MTRDIDLPEELEVVLARMNTFSRERNRPWVTLSYAQSLDGSIAAQRGTPLALSGSATLKITHHLRAKHTAILIGIGTLLADDPQLSVRLVPGENPQPVILDSHLRFPLTARLLQGREPWIITTAAAQTEREAALVQAGARIFRTNVDQVSIIETLTILAQESIDSIMVEGGADVITSFFQSQLVDLIVLTISPRFVGGLHAIENRLPQNGPLLEDFAVNRFQNDLLVWGHPRWGNES